jgi:hypothetical protein
VTPARLFVALAVTLLMAGVFHSLARSRKTDPELARRVSDGVPMFPRDPLLMALLFDIAVAIVVVLLIVRLLWPEKLAIFE